MQLIILRKVQMYGVQVSVYKNNNIMKAVLI